MRAKSYLTTATAILIVLLSTGTVMSVIAPNVPQSRGDGILQAAASGTAGRIARFINATDLGNSLIHQNGSNIGIGTIDPTARLDIRATNALHIRGATPYLSFRDTNVAAGRFNIQAYNGGARFVGEDWLSGANPGGFVRIDRAGRVGFGAANPERAIQIGPGVDPMFTIEPSDASPNAGYIRFGDGTGWQLHFGRSRQGSGGTLTTGTAGVIMSIKDNSPSGIGGTVILKHAVQVDSLYGSGASPTPVCRNSLNLLSLCGSSRRYKTDIKPFSGGLQLVNRLQPVSFVWKEDRHEDIGLIAEDVAEVEPRLTFKNGDGVIEGVNYSQLTTTLIDAIKEQQAQIEDLKAAVARLEERNRKLLPLGDSATP